MLLLFYKLREAQETNCKLNATSQCIITWGKNILKKNIKEFSSSLCCSIVSIKQLGKNYPPYLQAQVKRNPTVSGLNNQLFLEAIGKKVNV